MSVLGKNYLSGQWRDPADRPPPVQALDWVGARVALDMEDFFDAKD